MISRLAFAAAALIGLWMFAQAAPFGTSGAGPGSAPLVTQPVYQYCQPTNFGSCTGIAASPTDTAVPANLEYTYVTKFAQSQFLSFTQSGGKVRLALFNPLQFDTSIYDNFWIGAGNVYPGPPTSCVSATLSICAFNFDNTPAPVRVTCNGANNWTLNSVSGPATCNSGVSAVGLTYLDVVSYTIPKNKPFMVSYDMRSSAANTNFNVTTLPTVSPINTNLKAAATTNFTGYNVAATKAAPASTAGYNAGTGAITLTWATAQWGNPGAGGAWIGIPVTLAGWTPSAFNGTWLITGFSGAGLSMSITGPTGSSNPSVRGTVTLFQAGLTLKQSGYNTQGSTVNAIARVEAQ